VAREADGGRRRAPPPPLEELTDIFRGILERSRLRRPPWGRDYRGRGLRPTEEPQPPMRGMGGMTAWLTTLALEEAYQAMDREYRQQQRLLRSLTPPSRIQEAQEEKRSMRPRVGRPLSPHIAGRGIAPGLREAWGRPEFYPQMVQLPAPTPPKRSGGWEWEVPEDLPPEPMWRRRALGWPVVRALPQPWKNIPSRYRWDPQWIERVRKFPMTYDERLMDLPNLIAYASPFGMRTQTMDPNVFLHEYQHKLAPYLSGLPEVLSYFGMGPGWPKLPYATPGLRTTPSMAFRQDIMHTPEWARARQYSTWRGTPAAPEWHEVHADYPSWVAEIPPNMEKWYPWLESALPWGIRRRR